MKRLTLVRHANAESQLLRGTDFERSLSRRGHLEAEALGKALLTQNLVPDLLIASAAQRARQTAEILSRELSLMPATVQHDERLYHADADTLLSIVQSTGAAARHLMLVCHNPAVSDLAVRLAPQAGNGPLDTAIACSIDFDIGSWNDAVPQKVLQARRTSH